MSSGRKKMTFGRYTYVTAPAASTTVPFGAKTITGAGGVAAPSGASAISGGTASGYTITGGYVVPTGTASATGNHTGGTLTFTGSSEVWTMDISSGNLANAYSFRTKAELTAALTAVGTASTGARWLMGRNVSITTMAYYDFLSTNFANTVTVTSHDTSNPVTFNLIAIRDCSNLTIDSVKVTSAPVSNGELVWIDKNSANGDSITISNCTICSTLGLDPSVDNTSAPGIVSTFYGIRAPGNLTNLTITGNTIYDVSRAINSTSPISITVTNNDCHNWWDDGIQIGQHPSATKCWVIGNDIYNPVKYSASHQDALQLVGSEAADWPNIIIRCNRIFEGSGLEDMQGIFLSNIQDGYYFDAIIECNFVQVGQQAGISVYNIKAGSRIRGNTVISDATVTLVPGFNLGDKAGGAYVSPGYSGAYDVSDNICERVINSLGATLTNNIVLGSGGATIPYANVFDNPTLSGVTLANMASRFNMKVGGPADTNDATYNAGCFGTGYENFTAKTYSNPRP